MNCTAFKSAINSAIDNRESPRPAIAEHLVDCRDDACRQTWNDAVLLDRAIASWRTTRPTVDVVEAVLSGCQTADRDAPLLVSSRLRSARAPATVAGSAAARAATAAAALAVLALLLLPLPSGGDRPVAVQPPPSAESRDPAGDAGLTCVAYAQSAAHIVTDAVVLTLGGSEQVEDSTVTPPGIGWEADWPPLGEVHAALDDLLESLPAEPPQS